MKKTVILAGGGTGGHVFPLIAIGQALRKLDPSLAVVFVGTARGMETRLVPEQGFELSLLDVLPIRGGGLRGAVRGALRAAALLPACRALLQERRALGVLSVGGYAAGPISLAARTLDLPVAVVEPNSVIGLSNLLIAPFAQRAYTAFEEAEGHFPELRVQRLGVPIREGFSQAPSALRGPNEPLRVLLLGGSQGARSLNDAVPRAFARVKRPVALLHQCGAAHVETVSALHAELLSSAAPGSSFEVQPFLSDMQGALAWADLVVSRSGASAVSEIAVVGRPSLLIPYPFAAGDHQRVNAEALERAGAAVLLHNREATPERLEVLLCDLLSDGQRRQRMAVRAAALGKPGAAHEIARDFLNLCEDAP